jgi:hypothetical protein
LAEIRRDRTSLVDAPIQAGHCISNRCSLPTRYFRPCAYPLLSVKPIPANNAANLQGCLPRGT